MISLHNEWQIQTNIERHSILQSSFCIIKWEEVVASILPQALQEPKPVKECESNERERERWEEFGSITILSRMILKEGVRGFFYSLGRPRDPSWIFNTCQRSKGQELKLNKACSF